MQFPTYPSPRTLGEGDVVKIIRPKYGKQFVDVWVLVTDVTAVPSTEGGDVVLSVVELVIDTNYGTQYTIKSKPVAAHDDDFWTGMVNHPDAREAERAFTDARNTAQREAHQAEDAWRQKVDAVRIYDDVASRLDGYAL